MSSELKQVELSIEAAKEKIELSKCLDRLLGNRDFKTLITDNYLRDAAVRLVKLKASPGVSDEKSQKYIEAQLNGIGAFNQFLMMIETDGMHAEKAIELAEEERENILNEED